MIRNDNIASLAEQKSANAQPYLFSVELDFIGELNAG